MKQEEKDLLLRDLSARLPYGVKCNVGDNKPYTLSKIEIDDNNDYLLGFIEMKDGLDMQVYLSEVKPYLFPISSMTKEQKKEYAHILVMSSNLTYCQLSGISIEDWFRKNHFDYRGLIEKGFAIDATGL